MTGNFTCGWCERDMLITNKSRHLSTCIFNIDLKAPNLIFQKKVEVVKEEAREMLGHKRKSVAVYSYIDV